MIGISSTVTSQILVVSVLWKRRQLFSKFKEVQNLDYSVKDLFRYGKLKRCVSSLMQLSFSWPFRAIMTLQGDKVIMLIHIYPHKPLRKIKWACAIPRLTAHFTRGLMSDLMICELWKEYGHAWFQMFWLRPDVIKQYNSSSFGWLSMIAFCMRDLGFKSLWYWWGYTHL